MSSTKLTPLEVLQKQKARLRLQSEVLTETLENDLNYIQHNMGTIISNTVVDAVVSKSPPIVKSLLNRGKNPETGHFDRLGLVEGILDILPAFIKGSKGWLAHLALLQLRKWFFKGK